MVYMMVTDNVVLEQAETGPKKYVTGNGRMLVKEKNFQIPIPTCVQIVNAPCILSAK